MNRILKTFAIAVCAYGISKSQNLDLNTIRLAQRQVAKSSNVNSNISKRDKNQDHFIIDKLVDPNNYIVGPGDQLHINIISSNETYDHSLIISPTGQLLIPSVGMIDCNGLK